MAYEKYERSSTQGRWHSLLGDLGVEAHHLTGRNVPCPLCGGEDRFRFLNTDGAGTWICNQCGTGDGMHLVEKFRGVSFRDAVKLVQEKLPQATVATAPKPKDMRHSLRRMWQRALRLTREPLDPVTSYLERRGVWVGGISSDIRYLPDAAYYTCGIETGKYPAMIACVRDKDGNPTTTHITYLDHAGNKAEVPAAKKILSAMGEGGHIRLLDRKEGDQHLNVAEGIETAFAANRLRGGATYATISASGMRNFFIPPWVQKLYIWGDNDENFTGQAAAFALANRAAMAGTKVEVLIPARAGSDWADQQEGA